MTQDPSGFERRAGKDPNHTPVGEIAWRVQAAEKVASMKGFEI